MSQSDPKVNEDMHTKWSSAEQRGDETGLHAECVGIMREHLKTVGIEATYADDVAALAAAEIKSLRVKLNACVRALDLVEISFEIIIRCLDESSLKDRALEAAREAIEQIRAAKGKS